MKKCPYCGHMNDDQAKGCQKCKAGFPQTEEKTEPVKASKRKKQGDE